MSGEAQGWDEAVSAWARSRPDIQALVQIGSRVQEGSAVDAWSDYDYHLVTSRPGDYRDGRFTAELGDCWVSGVQVAFGNAVKVTAVYEGAMEADFVILGSLDVRIVMAAIRWPRTRVLWPRLLRRGVESFRIVAGPGGRVVKGGAPWENRYRRVTPLRAELTEAQFRDLCGEFWTQLVWAAKKAARGELRASQRALHVHLVENALRVLQEEALLAGRRAFPLSRRAEGWLTPEQLAGTQIHSSPEKAELLGALRSISEAFTAASRSVATRRGWSPPEPDRVRSWLASLAA
jgi:hypothetical protein